MVYVRHIIIVKGNRELDAAGRASRLEDGIDRDYLPDLGKRLQLLREDRHW
jgi:hypothetical protein